MARDRRATWMLWPPEVADFGDGQLDEILPVRSPIHEPKPARGIAYPSFVQVPVSHTAQQMVNLVDGENRGGGVIDRW